ncbi:MAG: hypothetical protein KC800_23115, partial [Candidatus Eremiobacteraeota bacterium]|nr:hypothetical protein [Candidatus Eremiobacteraeota bacterium]
METSTSSLKKGYALVLVLGFAAVLAVFTASIASQTALNLRSTERRTQTDLAYYAAQTGTQFIISLLYDPPPPDDYDEDGYVGTWLGEDRSARVIMDATDSEAIAHLFHNLQGIPGGVSTAPDGTVIPPDYIYITSLGVVNGQYDSDGNLTGGVQHRVTTMGSTLAPDYPLMPQAIYAARRATINGTIDHFDSRQAVPAAPPYFPYWGGSSVGPMDCPYPDASVVVDQDTFAGNVTLGPNAHIDGHLLLSPSAAQTELENLALSPQFAAPRPMLGGVFQFSEANVHAHAGDNDKVNGFVGNLPFPRTPFQIDLNQVQLDGTFPSGDGTISGGETLNLQEGGIYLQEGFLAVQNGGQVVVQDTNGDGEIDDTILLVEGNITISDSPKGVNGDAPPHRLKLFSLESGSQFQMTNSEAFCLVAGNDLTIDIDGSSILWGAVIGNEVTLQDGALLHFDVAMRDPQEVARVFG